MASSRLPSSSQPPSSRPTPSSSPPASSRPWSSRRPSRLNRPAKPPSSGGALSRLGAYCYESRPGRTGRGVAQGRRLDDPHRSKYLLSTAGARMTGVLVALAALLVFGLLLSAASVRILREYERGVVFRL